MSFSQRFASQVLEKILLWPERFPSLCVGLRPDDTGDEKVKQNLVRYLSRVLRDRHDDDLEAAIDRLVPRGSTIVDWYESLLTANDIEVECYSGQPRIVAGSFVRWWRLTKSIDPDALITLWLSGWDQADAVVELKRWRVLAASADCELERLLRGDYGGGLADLHVHLGGSDPIPLLWQRLVNDEVRVRGLRRYSDSALRELACDPPTQRAREKEKELLLKAIQIRGKLERRYRGYESQRGSRQVGFLDEKAQVPEVFEERRLLARVWQDLRDDFSESLAKDFDGYLFAKNSFFHHHHHTQGTNPGLTRFRLYLDESREEYRERSRCVRSKEVTRQVLFASESPDLRYLELRIAPFDCVGDYLEFFKMWEWSRRRDPLSELRKDLVVRFVVHFIRPDEPDPVDGPYPFERLRRRLDRQSAVLHLFRQRAPDLASHIVGLDVANLERHAPPDIFIPYLRFLRGHDVNRLDMSWAGCDAWRRLKKQRLACHPVALPKLGLTFHVGEDFFHPLEGMRHMASVVEGLGLVAGDRLGHGLAAGWDLEDFYGGRGRGLTLPRGVLLDDLVWLHRRLIREGSTFLTEIHQIGDRIADLSCQIYGRDSSPGALERLRCKRWELPPKMADPTPSSPEQRLLQAELFDKKCRRARSTWVPLPLEVCDSLKALKAVQESFLQELAAKRLVVELNPSSNWALSNFPDLRKHPFHRYLEVQGNAIGVTINTDDPGIFGTRLDHEYALMLDAMMARGASEGRTKQDCLEVLDRVRRNGLRCFFGGPEGEGA